MKRTAVCGALENGGLNMIDLKQMQAAFLLQWVFAAVGLDVCSKHMRSMRGVIFLKIFLLPLETNTCVSLACRCKDAADIHALSFVS